jgi:hypothetical protein
VLDLFNCSSRAEDQTNPIPTPFDGDKNIPGLTVDAVVSGDVTRSESFGDESFNGLFKIPLGLPQVNLK